MAYVVVFLKCIYLFNNHRENRFHVLPLIGSMFNMYVRIYVAYNYNMHLCTVSM